MKKTAFTISLSAMLLVFAVFLFPTNAFCATRTLPETYPKKANYYLGQMQYSDSFIERMASYDLLILTPSQMKHHRTVIQKIRDKNPDIVMLAYVPSQSYNVQYWPQDVVFRFLDVEQHWWFRDSKGTVISPWPGLKNINLDPAWSRNLVSFINRRITNVENVDGIFFDIVSDNISWLNNGDIDLNNDGRKDTPAEADRLWLERTEYLFEYAKEHLDTDFIVMNGSSHPELQEHVHGRMFETFPTPWEGDGSWSVVMTNARKNKLKNQKPNITIINSNSNNTGDHQDYQRVRFGLTSALLEDAYFSFDFGDRDHGQLWYYDEYDVDLGAPISDSRSTNGQSHYSEDIWQRAFQHGVAVVNSSKQEKQIDLGGEFEKIHGTQDTAVNDGAIISELQLEGEDGLLLLRTFQTLEDIVFTNGAFARFFRPDGTRVKNGFFVFEDEQKGGYDIAHVDIDGDGKRDVLRLTQNKLSAWRSDGQRFMRVYPYGANYKGEMDLSFGDIDGDGDKEVIVAPGPGSAQPIKIYNYSGTQVYADWYPLGIGYTGGYSVAVEDIDGPTIVLGQGKGREPRVSLYTNTLTKKGEFLAFETAFRGGVNVAAGDVTGDGVAEIVTSPGKGGKPWIRIYNAQGKEQFSSFLGYSSFSYPGLDVRVLDVDFDGIGDIVGLSDGVGI